MKNRVDWPTVLFGCVLFAFFATVLSLPFIKQMADRRRSGDDPQAATMALRLKAVEPKDLIVMKDGRVLAVSATHFNQEDESSWHLYAHGNGMSGDLYPSADAWMVKSVIRRNDPTWSTYAVRLADQMGGMNPTPSNQPDTTRTSTP